MSDKYNELQIDWLLVFEDNDVPNIPIPDEDTAWKALEFKSQNWNCHLFKRVKSEAGIEYPEPIDEQRIKDLQQQVNELKASNERLRDLVDVQSKSLATYGKHPIIEERARNVLKETPKQSLTKIQGEAILNNLPAKIEPDEHTGARYCLGYNDLQREMIVRASQLIEDADSE